MNNNKDDSMIKLTNVYKAKSDVMCSPHIPKDKKLVLLSGLQKEYSRLLNHTCEVCVT